MDIKNLIDKLEKNENKLLDSTFIAPIVKNGSAAVRIDGLVYTFKIKDKDKEGWFVLKPVSDTVAKIVEEVLPWQISEYLDLFPKLKVILVDQIEDKWIGVPAYKKQAYDKYGIDGHIIVCLCDGVQTFDHVDTRFDGINSYFEQIDSNSDAELYDNMRKSLKDRVAINTLTFKGMTPEDREVYSLLVEINKKKDEQERKKTLAGRIEWSLARMGARLEEHRASGKNVTIKWSTENRSYNTVVEKDTLRVVSAGLCLNNGDRSFDLTSLVGVVKYAERQNRVHITRYDDNDWDD